MDEPGTTSVRETLNALHKAEAQKICGAQRHAAAAQLSVANGEDALQHDTDPYRQARHAEDQPSRCLVSPEYADH